MTTIPGVRIRRHRLLVGGHWSDAENGEVAVVVSPATGEPVAEVAAAGPGDVERTVAQAHEAFERHRWRTPFWAGKASGRGRVGGRHIFEAMTQIRSVAFDVGEPPH